MHPWPAVLRLHFVLDPRATHWPDLGRLDEGSIEACPDRFVGGRNSWIAQTCVRLREPLEVRGWRVTAGAAFLPGAINVVHRDDANRFSPAAAGSFLVVVRADRAPVHACDVAIAQNALALRANERFVPLWPQPGLRPRHSGRGDRVECLAYHGRMERVPTWFRQRGFLSALQRRGVRFEPRARSWNDYSGVDVVLAVRDECARVLSTKPATKLYNGWLAGVPVLASPEPAYRALVRDPLDLMEIGGPHEALQAIDRLRRDPQLYRAMVSNGLARGAAFDVDATRARWLDLLEREVAPRYLHARSRLPFRMPWFIAALARQRLASRWHKAIVALERHADPGDAPRVRTPLALLLRPSSVPTPSPGAGLPVK